MQSYRVRHITRYHYNCLVPVSHHAAKLLPRQMARQRCLASGLKIDPLPGVIHESVDFFGNRCSHFTITKPHLRLEVEAFCEVEVEPFFLPDQSMPLWEDAANLVRSPKREETFDAYAYIFPSTFVPNISEVRAYTEKSFCRGVNIRNAALELMERIHQDFSFDPQATQVSTPLADVVKSKRGVCQDFAHFQIACFRSMGLPARYVSGYLRTIPPEGQNRLVGVDASHAWVQFFCPDFGWIDMDPTNNLVPSDSHITVAWGRDYEDVSPLRGITYGGGSQLLEVSVDVEAL